MSEFVISTRYANALMEISEENNSFKTVVNDITIIHNTLVGSKELRNLLINPIVNSEKKLSILNEIFDGQISVEVKNFIKLIVEKGRENLLPDITKRFLSLADDKLNQVKVSVSSAIELDGTQKEKINTRLKEILNKNIVADYKIDNSIIGGFKVRFKDTIIDASVQHQLEILKKKLFEQNYLSN
jgi:F-type H+-transporting ATPase subunit delta